MLAELHESGKRIGLRNNQKMRQLIKNAYRVGEGNVKSSELTEALSYVYLEHSNMKNGMGDDLNRR